MENVCKESGAAHAEQQLLPSPHGTPDQSAARREEVLAQEALQVLGTHAEQGRDPGERAAKGGREHHGGQPRARTDLRPSRGETAKGEDVTLALVTDDSAFPHKLENSLSIVLSSL